MTTDSVYKTLSRINASDITRQKGNFSYLSWAHAWGTLKDKYPDSTYEKHYFDHGGMELPYTMDMDGYAYVKVSVTVSGQTLTETMPVLNHQNKAIQKPTSFNINTSLQRCLAKAIAMHGLGIYIYAGEDLPSLQDTADAIKEAVADDSPEIVEQLYSQCTDKEKKELWKAITKGGYFSQSEKTYIQQTGYKIVNEDVTNDLLEVMTDKNTDWPEVEKLLLEFYGGGRGENPTFDIDALPIGYVRQAITLINERSK